MTKMMTKMKSSTKTAPVTRGAAAKGPGKSVDDFRKNHDKNFIVPEKIKAALKQLGNGWEYENNFIKLAGLSNTDFALFRDDFEDYWLSTAGHNPKRVWCGTKELRDELKAMVN